MKGPPEMCEPRINTSSASTSGGHRLENKIDFDDYMWMGEEEIEDFDKKCEDEFWEEFLMEQAYEQMIAEEEERETQVFVPGADGQAESGRGNRDSRRYIESQQPPQPQRISELELHMAELNMNSNNAHSQGHYNARPRMCHPHFRQRNQHRHQAPSQYPNRQQQQRGNPQPNYSQLPPQQQQLMQLPHNHVIVATTPMGIGQPGLSTAGGLPRLNPNAPVFVPRGGFAMPIPVAAQQHRS